ncbi:MAG: phage protein Gp36 family protein [bacterium]
MHCTVSNIKDLIPENLLLELTSGNDAVIEKAIAGASATIDAYLMGSYDGSNQLASPFLQSVAEKITVYNLYLVSACDDTPQIVTSSYIEAISSLEKIQSGVISISTESSDTERQSEVFINKTEADKMFSKERFKGF